MKEIRIVTRRPKLAPLHAALRGRPDFPGMTVSAAEGYAHEPDPEVPHSIREELTDHVPRVRIEIVVADDALPALHAAVLDALGHGPGGDSLVWVLDVERADFVRRRL